MNNYYLLLFSLSGFLFSCQKNINREADVNCCLIEETTVEGGTQTTREFHYHDENRIGFITESFTGSAGNSYDTIGVVFWHNTILQTFEMNDMQFDYEWQNDRPIKINHHGNVVHHLHYDSLGQLYHIENEYSNHSEDPHHYNYIWEDGNIVKVEARDSNGALIWVDHIRYDTEKNFYECLAWLGIAENPERAYQGLSNNNSLSVIREIFDGATVVNTDVIQSLQFDYHSNGYPKSIVLENGELELRYDYCE